MFLLFKSHLCGQVGGEWSCPESFTHSAVWRWVQRKSSSERSDLTQHPFPLPSAYFSPYYSLQTLHNSAFPNFTFLLFKITVCLEFSCMQLLGFMALLHRTCETKQDTSSVHSVKAYTNISHKIFLFPT